MKTLLKQLLIILISARCCASIEYNPKALGGNNISEELFLHILHSLPENGVLLELGSGSGSGELVKYCDVYSIEHDKNWLNKYPVHYIYAPIQNYGSYKWYNNSRLSEELPSTYHAILVDGPPGIIGRIGFLNQRHLFNLSVPIFIDDVQRRAEMHLLITLARILKKSYRIIKCKDRKSYGIIQ